LTPPPVLTMSVVIENPVAEELAKTDVETPPVEDEKTNPTSTPAEEVAGPTDLPEEINPPLPTLIKSVDTDTELEIAEEVEADKSTPEQPPPIVETEKPVDTETISEKEEPSASTTESEIVPVVQEINEDKEVVNVDALTEEKIEEVAEVVAAKEGVVKDVKDVEEEAVPVSISEIPTCNEELPSSEPIPLERVPDPEATAVAEDVEAEKKEDA